MIFKEGGVRGRVPNFLGFVGFGGFGRALVVGATLGFVG